MQADGFQLVTDIYGQYRMDYEANQKCNIIFYFSCLEFASDQEAKKERKEGEKIEGTAGVRGKMKMIDNICYQRYTFMSYYHLTLVLLRTSFCSPSLAFILLKIPHSTKTRKTRVKCL